MFSDDAKPTPAIDVTWDIVASPASIKTDVTGTKKGSAARISGHAILVTANHKVPDRYKITWEGQRKSTSPDPTVLTLRDQSGQRALQLRFEGDHLRVISAEEDPFPRLTFSGRQSHEVTVYLNMSSRPTVQVDIKQGKMPLYTSPPLPLMDSGFRSLDELDINVSSQEASYAISKFIAIDADAAPPGV